MHWPDPVKRAFASDLEVVRNGGIPSRHAQRLKGFNIKLWELKHRSGARVVYTVEYVSIDGCIHIIDAFDKDARENRKMRTSDKRRLEARVAELQRRLSALSKRAH